MLCIHIRAFTVQNRTSHFFLWLLSCCCMSLPILLSFMLADLQLSTPPPPPRRDHNAFCNLQRFALLCLLISSLSSSIPTPADLSKKQWKGLPLLWSLIWMYIPASPNPCSGEIDIYERYATLCLLISN